MAPRITDHGPAHSLTVTQTGRNEGWVASKQKPPSAILFQSAGAMLRAPVLWTSAAV